MPSHTEGVPLVVPDAAARRLSNQIARAYRGTYGARAGFRTIMRSVSGQMLGAGSSPEVVSRALTDYVRNCAHPATADPSASNDTARADLLASLTAECVSDVALEMARPRPTGPMIAAAR